MSIEVEALMIDISGRIPAQPTGWVYDGIRKINNYEYHFDGVDWVLWLGGEQSTGIYPAAVKAKTWQPATEDDIGKTGIRVLHKAKFVKLLASEGSVIEELAFPVEGKAKVYSNGKILHIRKNGDYVVFDDQEHVMIVDKCEVMK